MRKFLLFAIIFYSVLLLLPNYRHYPMDEVSDFLLIVAHWGLSALGLYLIIFIISLNKYLCVVLLPILALASGITAFFVWQIDISVNPALIESIMHTDAGEVANYMSLSLCLFVVFLLLTTAFFCIWRFRIKWQRKELLVFLSAALISGIIFNTVNHKRRNTLNNRAPFVFYRAIKEYRESITDASAPRKSAGEIIECKEDSLTVILVIGEALRADHLQMNGYQRITMPLMEKRNVISFPNTFSPHTHTAASIPYILTRAKPGFPSPSNEEHSLISLFSKCGYKTTWLANQNPIKTFSYFTKECDSIIVNKPQLEDYSNTPKYDSDLLPHFERLLADDSPLKLIVVHLAGNHWWYNKNLPPDYHYFTPVLNNKRLSADNRERMINTYDNVTRFTDYVLDQMMKQVEDKKAWMIFLADHGQSFGEDGKWLHGNDRPQEQNPACFAWFSQSYQESLHTNIEQMQNRRLDTIDTAFLFHTLLKGSGIKTTTYEADFDLFSSP